MTATPPAFSLRNRVSRDDRRAEISEGDTAPERETKNICVKGGWGGGHEFDAPWMRCGSVRTVTSEGVRFTNQGEF